MSLVITKAAAVLKRSADQVEHVKFEAHKPKKRKSNERQVSQTKCTPEFIKSQELDLKKIRHEVVKFGMSGFDAPKKEEARIALAVSLGAKPPRRKYQNYKELMVQRKEEKQKEKERKEAMGRDLLRKSVAVGKKKKNNVNDVGGVLNVYGKVDKKKVKEIEKKSLSEKKRKKGNIL